MRPQEVCLLVGEVHPYLGAQLEALAKDPPKLLYLLLAQYSEELCQSLRWHYLAACWRAGAFRLTCPELRIHALSEAAGLEPGAAAHLLLSSEELCWPRPEPEVGQLGTQVSEALNRALEHFARQGLTLERGQLVASIGSQNPLPGLLTYSELSLRVKSLLKELSQQAPAEVSLNDFRFLLALELHKSIWFKDLRPILNQVLARLSTEPEDPRPHLLAALFRRRRADWRKYSPGWPEALRASLEPAWLEAHCPIRVLDPPDSFRVAIFMPTYNRLSGLKQALECVFSQSYRDWEVHIYDDASVDGTEAYCRELVQQDDRILYHRNPRNQGFFGIQKSYRQMSEQTSCELITALADDDRWQDGHLEALMSVFRARPWVAEVYGSFYQVRDYQQIVGQFGPFDCCEDLLDPIRQLQNAIRIDTCPVGAVMRKHLLAEFADFDLTSQRHFGLGYAPWDYMLHIKLLASYELAHQPQVTMMLNVASDTGSANWDALADLLELLQVARDDYYRLCGEALPAEIAGPFLTRRAETMIAQFRSHLASDEAEPWQSFVLAKQPVWQRLVELRRLVERAADPASAACQ